MPIDTFYEETTDAEGKKTVFVTRRSILSGKVARLQVAATMEEIRAWERGKLIQDAMPNSDASEREFFLSGITKEEWKAAMEDPLT